MTTVRARRRGENLDLQKKTLFAACLGALALLVVVFSSTRFVLVHGFATIEAAEARQSIERVNQALQMELHRLATEAIDNGHWDQAFDYANGRRDAYINENFTRDGLDTIHVQVLWIGDPDGNTRVSRGTRDALPGAVT